MKRTPINYCVTLIMLFLTVSCLSPFKKQQVTMPPITYTHGPDEKPTYDFLNSLADRYEFIFEAKMESNQSFYGYVDGHKGIYTCSVMSVYKVFKGNIKTNKIEICTEGGVIYDKETNYGVFSHCDDCNYGDGTNIGEVGIVFAHASEIVNPESKVKIENRFNLDYCISINKWASSYESAKGRFYDVNYFLYQPLEEKIGRKKKVIKKYDFYELKFEQDFKKKAIKNNTKTSSLAPTISSISPDTIAAGTSSILTINGTNFDSTTMKIQFLNANNGGAVLLNRL